MGVFNAERYLADTIQSILAQTYDGFELVMVNDGSRDGSLRIMRQFEALDSRVKVITRGNTGIVGAANEGIAASRGEFIARHDADDLSEPTRFEKQVAFLDSHPEVVAVGSRMAIIDPYGSPLEISDHKLTHAEIEAELLCGSGWALPQPAAMMRRQAFERAGRYRDTYLWSEDLDLFLRMAMVGQLANLAEPLVKWRRHLGSTNHRHHDRQVQNKRLIIEEAYAARGLTPPADVRMLVNAHLPPWKQLCNWGWQALRHGNARIARLHALAAIKRRPISFEAWKLAMCAVRGH